MNAPVCYLILGSNLGDRLEQLALAKRLITECIASIVAESRMYETQPWGYEHQPWFLNQVVALTTDKNPVAVLALLKEIERQGGRQPGEKWHARHLDIDILLWGDLVLKQNGIEIPHPLMHTRNFVLIPLLDIAPDVIHPRLGKTIEELFSECRDTGEVYIFNPDEQVDPI